MISSAVEDIVENAADRLARLVRTVAPASARLNLPDDDDAAAEVLRKKLEGLWND